MYIEIDKNNYVLGYSDKPSGTSIETQQNIPNFTNIQKLKFENDVFVVEDSDELRNLVLAKPMRLLREERNMRIAKSDWMANSDVTMTDEWRTYRQALRDITESATSLDDVTWPTEPTG